MTTDSPDPGKDPALDPSDLRDLIATGTAEDRAADGDPIDAAETEEPGEGLVALSKGDLFARVKARTEGVRGRDIRMVIDAVLEELGAALVAGDSLKLPPLGTLKVQRNWESANADLAICKLRRKKPGAGGNDPLAEPAEES